MCFKLEIVTIVSHSTFLLSHFLNATGNSDNIASNVSINIESIEMCPVVVVSSYRVVPALMNRKDGGATPVE